MSDDDNAAAERRARIARTTPDERLAWLRQAQEFAAQSGAFARARIRKLDGDLRRTAVLTSPTGATFTLHGSPSDASVMQTVAENGTFEPEVMSMLAELLEPEAVVLDVGANIGVLTLVIAHLCPQGRVVAFEPGSEASHFLRANLAANGFSNVEVEEQAVLDVTGQIDLQVAPSGSAWSFVSTRLESASPEAVRCTRLDDWMETANLKRLDLVKIDIEGCELRALDGASELLRRFRPYLIAEYNPLVFRQLQGARPEELYFRLRSYSRYLYALWPEGKVVRLTSLRHLDKLVSLHGLLNLLATPRPLPPRPEDARRFREGLAQHLRMVIRDNRWRKPPHIIWLTTTDVRIDAPPSGVQVAAGATFTLAATVRNNSRLWVSSDNGPIPMFCGHRWFTDDGVAVGEPLSPSSLPADNLTALGAIPPGGSRDITCNVSAPAQPGRYVLRLGLVQRQFLWIDDIEPATGATVAVEVVANSPSR